MPLEDQIVVVDKQDQAPVRYERNEFPLARFLDRLDHFADGAFLCHWHKEFELATVIQGRVEYHVGGKTFCLNPGDCIFIGAETFHSARQLTDGSIIFCIDFLPSFLDLMCSPVLWQKYVKPICDQKIDSFFLSGRNEEISEILNSLTNINNYDINSYNYELSCLKDILNIWSRLYSLFREAAPQHLPDSDREARIRAMLSFIKDNFSSKITVGEIARAANVSRSECFRCFSHFCHTTPIEYVTSYRLQSAAHELTHSKRSIADICFSCGFSGQSYFGRAFRKAYGISPSEFRRRMT